MSDVVRFPLLGWIRGPYPVDLDESVPITPLQRVALKQAQRRLGVTVDGILGPQTWVAICSERGRSDPDHG